MRSLFAILFLTLLIVTAIFVLVTTASLPDPVATSFGGNGLAHAYMSRSAYRVYLLLFTIGLPLIVVAMIGWLPHFLPNRINIPNRDYWLAPEHREQTLTFLSEHALRLGCLILVFMVGIQWLVIRANTLTPPQLANRPFIILLVGLFISIVGWILAIFRRFSRTR
ncbi:MAG: hypothetical protein AB1489_06840 [Acidobacteriota bacterium]